jgi:hypothetical protein
MALKWRNQSFQLEGLVRLQSENNGQPVKFRGSHQVNHSPPVRLILIEKALHRSKKAV